MSKYQEKMCQILHYYESDALGDLDLSKAELRLLVDGIEREKKIISLLEQLSRPIHLKQHFDGG